MEITENGVLLTFALVMSIISLFFTILSTIVHHLIPKLRRNPGQLVHINCCIQIIADGSMVFLIASPNLYFNVIGCHILGVIETASLLLADLYIFFFCLEIYILVSRKIVKPHTMRVRIYHVVAIVLTLAIVVAAFFTQGFGANNGMYCLVTTGSVTEQIFFFIVWICLISIWVLSILTMKKLNSSDSNLTKRYLITILVSTVFISVSSCIFLVLSFNSSNKHLRAIAMALGVSVGLTLSIGRLYNRALLREIALKLCKKKIVIEADCKSFQLQSTFEFLNDSLINVNQDHISLSQYFESESLKTLLRIFTCLSLRFSKIANNLEAYEEFNEYYFEEEHFISVLSVLSIDKVSDCINYAVYDPNVTVKEIQPTIFKKIRDTFKLEEESLSG
jgi:hypothetical protein